jgi:hypothetical protein
MGDCETPLQQAADAVLQRNALIVARLDGASLACSCYQTRVLSAALVCTTFRLHRFGKAARWRTAERG